MSISREQLLELHRQVSEQSREVMTKKNHDYAHEGDVFRNFRYFGGLGILVRLSDKLARLRSFEENGVFKVEDEKLLDTIVDMLNYSVIYLAFKTEDRMTAAKIDKQFVPTTTVVVPGPFCCHCDNLADFTDPAGDYCRPCAERRKLDTNNMTLLERA